MSRFCDSIIVVVPSVWQEAFGLSVIEGMASGKTVIASKIGGIPEIIKDGEDGLLFRPGDVDALTEKILAVADDPVLRETIGAAARETVVQKFHLCRQKEELTSLFYE